MNMDVRCDSLYSRYMVFNSALPVNPDFRMESNLAIALWDLARNSWIFEVCFIDNVEFHGRSGEELLRRFRRTEDANVFKSLKYLKKSTAHLEVVLVVSWHHSSTKSNLAKHLACSISSQKASESCRALRNEAIWSWLVSQTWKWCQGYLEIS